MIKAISRTTLLLTLLLIVITGFSQKETKDSVSHTLYLIGDAGEPEKKTDKVFEALIKQANETGKKSTIVFLGDNIYPRGLPKKETKGRKKAESIIKGQLAQLKTLKAKTYFIPGNHDWAQGRTEGLTNILNQEKFIEKYLEDDEAFVPVGGCPGPVKLKLINT